jgi:hypothetical protein
VKETHLAKFDEVWYVQQTQSPAAQLLHDLGLEAEESMISEIGPEPTIAIVPYPLVLHPLVENHKWAVPPLCLHAQLPLQCTKQPRLWAAAAARTVLPEAGEWGTFHSLLCRHAQVTALGIANEYNIG